MKKVFYCFIFVIFAMPSFAEDLIPLFDDLSKTAPTSAKDKEKSLSITNNLKDMDIRKPRLGRDAEPLDSIVLAPFPNVVLDLGDKKQKIVEKKQEETPKIDVITRDVPVEIAKPNNITVSMPKSSDKFDSRYDVKKFKVADIALGLTPDDVEYHLADLGYRLKSRKTSLPLEHAKVFEQMCRKTHRLSILKDIKLCITELAEEANIFYIKSEKFERKTTGDSIYVEYTSPLTDNVAYRIIYTNKGDSSINTNSKTLPTKIERRDSFFNLVFNTYGLPDDSNNLIWGLYEDVYMKVGMTGSGYDAYIVLDDKVLRDEDYTIDIKEAKKIKPEMTFSFNPDN